MTIRDTRGALAGVLQPPRVRRELAKRFFAYRATAAWNRSPSDVRDALTAQGCRRAVRARLQVSDRAGATDFGLEGQLVQKKGPWRMGPFLSESTFIPYDVIRILQGLH